MKINADASGDRLPREHARNLFGVMLCLILGIGWVRTLLTVFGWLMIGLLFNDSGASWPEVVAVVVTKISGSALLFLLLISVIVIFAWIKRWTTFAVVAVIPVAILDISPAGTFNRAIDAIYFALGLVK